jgi:hypothetical protein
MIIPVAKNAAFQGQAYRSRSVHMHEAKLDSGPVDHGFAPDMGIIAIGGIIGLDDGDDESN